MRISISQAEITAGVVAYLASRGITGLDASTAKIEFTAGRKGAGVTAVLVDGSDEPKKSETAVAAKPKAEPQPEPEQEAPAPVEEPAEEQAPQEAAPEAPVEGESLFG